MQNPKTHGLTRRGLMQGAAALGGAGLILPASMRPARAQPKRGGVLRIAMAHGNTTDSLDPAVYEQVFTQVLGTCLHGYLTEIAPDGSLVGGLAESWETDDAATWRITLKDGVTYHSGKTVTVDDVIASLNYHRGPDSTSAAKPIVEPITEMSADGNTLVVTLAAANADFPFILSDYHLPVMPSADGKVDPTSPDGCGGYVYESFEPGVQATLNRFADYWKSDAAFADRVELLAIVDPAARQNALLTGEVDVIDPVDLATVAMLERAPGMKVLSVPGSQHYVFVMDSRAAPYSDNNIRMALKYGIDRQQLVDTVLSGYGSLGNDHPIARSNRFFNTDLPQREYDPDQAKFYLKEAGLDSLDVTLSVADAAFTGAVDAAVLYSEKAAGAGINLTVDRAPNDGYWDNVWMKKPFCASYWGGRPTEDWMFTMAYAKDVPWNESFWDNARFNELLLAARSELDEAKRKDMYFEMQKICSDEGATITPMFSNYVMAASDKVGIPDTVAANWTLDGFRAVERWWIEG